MVIGLELELTMIILVMIVRLFNGVEWTGWS